MGASENQSDGANTRAVDMSVELAGVKLSSPMMMASGTCGYGLEYAPYTQLDQLGGFVTKSITQMPRKGNPPERIVETPAGMLNAIGLANVGLDCFIREKLPELGKVGAPVFVNVAGHSVDDYVAVCKRLDPYDEISGLELNVSCPNVKDGLTFGTDAKRLRSLVAEVRNVVRHSVLIVKLSPNVTDICAMAQAAIEGGAEVLSLINTFTGMVIHRETWYPMLANTSGGLSGPAIRPLAVHMIHKVYQNVAQPAGIPLIGMGGVMTWEDAVEFALAGATAIAVGSALFVNPNAPIEINHGLAAYLARKELPSFRSLIGQMKLPHCAE